MEPDHRTLGRETIQVRAVLPHPIRAFRSLARYRRGNRPHHRCPAPRHPPGGLAYATEETYVHWVVRFTRFCLECLKQTPQDAGTPALTAYLDYLALERNVSAATQKQALNAMVFLTRKVFGVEDFTIETPTHGHTQRRPPVVLSRREVAAILAHLEDPWKLAAQLMYGSGLRLMECLRLRVKDFDFDQGTITIHDGKGGKHRVVPLPIALEDHLKEYLAKAREKHLQDLAVGAGEVHMPEALLRKWPNASREWAWQYIFASATLCPHPRTGRVARHHLHEASMQRQFKDAVRKTDIAKRATCHSHAPFVCILLTPKRHRHPHRPGPPRPCRRLHHHDLPARHQTPGGGRPEPARSPVIRQNSHQKPFSPLLSWHALSWRLNGRAERAMGNSTHPGGICPFLYRTLYNKDKCRALYNKTVLQIMQ